MEARDYPSLCSASKTTPVTVSVVSGSSQHKKDIDKRDMQGQPPSRSGSGSRLVSWGCRTCSACRDGFWSPTSSSPGLDSRQQADGAGLFMLCMWGWQQRRPEAWNQEGPGWTLEEWFLGEDKTAEEHVAYRGCTGSLLGSVQSWTGLRLEQSSLNSGLACLNRQLKKERPKRVILWITP